MMDLLQKKMRLLEEERLKLSSQIDALMETRHQHLLETLKVIPTSHINIHTLIGGLLHVIETAQINTEKAEVWLQAGQKFCRHHPASKSMSSSKSTKKVETHDTKQS